MTDLQSFKKMIQNIGMQVIHKHHPRWATADRIIFNAVETKMCFSFGHKGELISISWGPYVDQDIGGDVEID